jgi:hypothetical protein
VSLVLPDEVPADEPPDALPPASELVLVRSASARWAVSLSEQLAEAGIAHRVDDLPDRSAYGVFVREGDVEAARRVDAGLVERELPDLPEGWDIGEETDDDSCPACGTAVAADAAECPDCGLALGGGS